MQPQAPSLPPQPSVGQTMNTTPLLASTIIFIALGLFAPFSLGMIFFNDAGNQVIAILGLLILGAGVISAAAQIIIALISTRKYLRTSGVAKATFILHLTLAVTMLVLAVCGITFAVAAPHIGQNFADASNISLVFISLSIQLGLFLVVTVFPALWIASVVMSFVLISKRPTLPTTPQ